MDGCRTQFSWRFSRTPAWGPKWCFKVGKIGVRSKDAPVHSLGEPGSPWPELIDSEAALDEIQTRPSPILTEFVRTLRGPLLLLGAGGKMGPSLAVLAKRAGEAAGRKLDVVAASRFSDARSRAWL